jgi:hypothetical protein
MDGQSIGWLAALGTAVAWLATWYDARRKQGRLETKEDAAAKQDELREHITLLQADNAERKKELDAIEWIRDMLSRAGTPFPPYNPDPNQSGSHTALPPTGPNPGGNP